MSSLLVASPNSCTIQISERNLKRTLRNPKEQEWVQPFNSFSTYKIEVKLSVIDPDAAKACVALVPLTIEAVFSGLQFLGSRSGGERRRSGNS